MSFAQAETSDPTLAGTADQLRHCLGEVAYPRNPQQIYNNMDTDPLIGPLPGAAGAVTCRRSLLAAGQTCGADPDAWRGKALRFSWANQQQGPPFAGSPSTVFGHVQGFQGLINALAAADATADLADIETRLRDLVEEGTPGTRLDRQHLDLGSTVLSRFQVWSYPAKNPAHPFAEFADERTEALNALGLGSFTPADEMIRWAHTLPDVKQAHRPTAWDSGAEPSSVYWRPGGYARRLDREEDGLPEFVHPPITGGQLVNAIEPLR